MKELIQRLLFMARGKARQDKEKIRRIRQGLSSLLILGQRDKRQKVSGMN